MILQQIWFHEMRERKREGGREREGEGERERENWAIWKRNLAIPEK
jgi:hypothetical protein